MKTKPLKNICYLLIFVVAFACSSKKMIVNNCLKNPFEELDSLQTSKQVLKYTIDTPKQWKKSRFSGGDWYVIEENTKQSLGYNFRKPNLYISQNKIRSQCKPTQNYTSKDYLEYYINYKSRWFKDEPFRYLLLKSKHKKYGDIYIIKHKWRFNNVVLSSSAFLFFYNNVGYVLEYKNEEKEFDKYLPEIEKMISSFAIKE